MKRWLKFYFLGFFCDRYGKEAASRSFFNVVLSLFLTIILLSGGLAAGFSASFGKHYKEADDFREFVYGIFAVDGDSRINLKIQNGKLSADIPEGVRINSFLNENDNAFGGYKLIVDTTPADTSFDDFTLICKDANGVEISYEDYRKLPETGKKNGTVEFKYSGKPLDVTVKQAEYIAYLEKISQEADSEYDSEAAKNYGELKHKKISGEISEEEYEIRIYTLYAKNYYPSYTRFENYGDAPTLRTYYTQAELIENEEKYLILLDDTCICSFKTEDGLTVNFASYYMGVDDAVISDEGLSENDIRGRLDKFVRQCFIGSGGLIFFVYIINLGNLFLLFVLIVLALALITFLLCKFLHLEFGKKYFGAVKTICSYLFYSALAAFILSIVLSFFYARTTVFVISEIAFVCLFVLRTIALIVTESVRIKRAAAVNVESANKTDVS